METNTIPGRRCGRGGSLLVGGASVKLALWDARTRQHGALFRCRLTTLTGLNSPFGDGPTNSLVPKAIAPLTNSPPSTGSEDPATLKTITFLYTVTKQSFAD